MCLHCDQGWGSRTMKHQLKRESIAIVGLWFSALELQMLDFWWCSRLTTFFYHSMIVGQEHGPFLHGHLFLWLFLNLLIQCPVRGWQRFDIEADNQSKFSLVMYTSRECCEALSYLFHALRILRTPLILHSVPWRICVSHNKRIHKQMWARIPHTPCH